MKTKIIYISGNEIFDVKDIRDAFDAVRNALNLDKNTVLFGVPVDQDDTGLATNNDTNVEPHITNISITPNLSESIVDSNENIKPSIENVSSKKRGKSRKRSTDVNDEQNDETNVDNQDTPKDKVVPILSVLSSKNNDDTSPVQENVQTTDTLEIIEDITQMPQENAEPEIYEDSNESDTEPDLEKLLSEMKPLEEDIAEEQYSPDVISETKTDTEPENIDATLEKLATEFVQSQDKITQNTKSSGRSKIGKLRNILPFKQSKHHDQGLGDLFGWAGVAANDDEFAVPGFFTTTSSKK